jgi:hypothetical protein
MLIDLFLLTAFKILSLFRAFGGFDYYVIRGISFLVQSIWNSVGFLYVYGHLCLLVRKGFFYNFIEDIYWPFKLGQ